jgi:hypothetical protein
LAELFNPTSEVLYGDMKPGQLGDEWIDYTEPPPIPAIGERDITKLSLQCGILRYNLPVSKSAEELEEDEASRAKVDAIAQEIAGEKGKPSEWKKYRRQAKERKWE